VRQREGRYLLRTNLPEQDPAKFGGPVEKAFKNLKGDLALRPIHHQRITRCAQPERGACRGAHLHCLFAYYGHTDEGVRCRLQALAPGLSPRCVFDKFAAVQMIDVHIPTTDGRELVLERNTEAERNLWLLLGELKLVLPEQPPPKIIASAPVTEPAL
jgi:hypothetical protein